MQQTLDTLLKIETPEGVELSLPVAGPVPRALAWSLDGLIKFGVFIVFGIVLGLLGNFGDGLFLIVAFFVLWFYNVFFEVLGNGATPGKRILGLRVTQVDGTPVSWSASLLRNLIRWVDFFPFYYGFGLVACLLSPKFQRLGDMAARTVVIHHDPTPMMHSPDTDVEPAPIRIPLSLDEQEAIMMFGERSRLISQSRANELAGILEGHITEEGQSAVQQLLANAKWLAGKR